MPLSRLAWEDLQMRVPTAASQELAERFPTTAPMARGPGGAARVALGTPQVWESGLA